MTETTFAEYGWKTKTVVRKYYAVRHIGRLMDVDTWINVNDRLFPHDERRKKCELCKKEWLDVPLLESVNIVIFKKYHRNKTVCDDCKCHILEAMGR